MAVLANINDVVGAIGGTILCLELIVLLLILVGINAGLFLGLRWVLGRTGWAHEKIAWALGLVTRYVEKGAGLAAAPVIVGTSAWRGLKAGLHRATHWPAGAALPADIADPGVAAKAMVAKAPDPSRAA